MNNRWVKNNVKHRKDNHYVQESLEDHHAKTAA